MILVRLHIYGKVPITCHNNQKIKEVAAREEWKNIITQGWIRTKED